MDTLYAMNHKTSRALWTCSHDFFSEYMNDKELDNITESEIQFSIKVFSNHSAPGKDSLCCEHFKYAHGDICKVLAFLF